MRKLVIGLLLIFTVLLTMPGHAQMVTGSGMEDFAKSFGVSAKGWSVQQTACSLGAHALWPDEEATFTFFVKPGQPGKGALKRQVSGTAPTMAFRAEKSPTDKGWALSKWWR